MSFYLWETYRICNFLANCCDYARKQYKAPISFSPEVCETSSKTGSRIRILYLLTGPIGLQCRRTKWRLRLIDPSMCLATMTWAESWGLCPLEEELGPHLAQCGLGRGLPPYQVVYLIDVSNRMATIERKRKALFLGGGRSGSWVPI